MPINTAPKRHCWEADCWKLLLQLGRLQECQKYVTT